MKIEIEDCNEQLVNLKKVCPGLVIDLGKEERAYLRESVAKMVCKAKSYLPKGMTFIIGSAWRSEDTQKRIKKRFIKHLRNRYPDWDKRKIKRAALKMKRKCKK